jgi:hypothetical protein
MTLGSSPPAIRSYLGPSAEWVDDAEVTFEHSKRQLADFLIQRLMVRVGALKAIDLPTELISVELRRQMAECAVDGNLLLGGELSEATWALLSQRESKESKV